MYKPKKEPIFRTTCKFLVSAKRSLNIENCQQGAGREEDHVGLTHILERQAEV